MKQNLFILLVNTRITLFLRKSNHDTMKQFFTILMVTAFFGLNAQIFINTNPKKETTKIPVTTPQTTERTEIKTTPVVTTPAVTTPAVTTTTVVTTPVVTTPQTTGTTNIGTTGTVGTTTTTTTTTTGGTSTGGSTSISPAMTGTVTKQVGTMPTLSTPVTGYTPPAQTGTSTGYTGGTTTTTTTGTTTTGSTGYTGGGTTTSYTGNGMEDVPPNAVPGKCYARCAIADKYGYVTETVMDNPKSIKKIKLPALYTTVYDTVIMRPKSTRTERVPADYEFISEQMMVAPATTKWVKGKADAGCLSANPEDCQVMCLVEVPAQYKTVQRKVMKNEAYDRVITIPMDYKIVAKQMKTQNERYVDIETPATYKTVQKRVLVEKGGVQQWREILCANQLTSARIASIQQALKNAGYNPGPIDDVFGAQTKAALMEYQRAKGLPLGNLNIETLNSLGVN